MLVISRKIEESVRVGDAIEIKILDVFSVDNSGSRKSKVASIGIQAPREIRILRGELAETLKENQAATQTARDLTGTNLGELLKKRSL
ncbi:MAG: carbon storage regulator [Oscillospiraceae bacterium]|nr:carbon storage regulator [Oscillospiraceae bacterium]